MTEFDSRSLDSTDQLQAETAIRVASNRMSRWLFLAFGLVVGLIVGSLTVVNRPPEVVREELVALEGGEHTGPVDVDEVAESDSDGDDEIRFVTRGGREGVAGSGPDGIGGVQETLGDGSVGHDEQAAGAVDNPADYKCAPGENGGATDTGVTGNRISVAANIVTDGPGASFLREAIVGIQAVIDEANVRGICGRQIQLTQRNDSWDSATGLRYIENYINDGAFALVVNPSSEGLDAAVRNGTIDREGVPVVGTDGMLISQYRWPEKSKTPGMAQWLWPVAASTISTMHIIVDHAVSEGAKSFGLVYDRFYKFGPEGKDAFVNAFNRLKSKHNLTSVYTLGLDDPNKSLYTDEVNTFNTNCGDCDLVAMLLTPATAISWIKSGGTFGDLLTSGPQTLFNRDFAVNCVEERNKRGEGCDLIVWTGYNPPVGALANLPDVAKYVSDVKSRNAQADVENSFTQGAYLGAQVFVEALNRVGPNVTRENLRQVLDSMVYESDLTNTLAWTPDNHFANERMQAFRVGYTPSGFTGWQDENTGWVKDPWVGQL